MTTCFFLSSFFFNSSSTDCKAKLFSFFFFFVFLIQPACLLSFAIDNNTFQPKLVDISLSLSQMWKCSVQRVECVLLLLPSSIDFKITYLNEICAGMQLIYLTVITHL